MRRRSIISIVGLAVAVAFFVLAPVVPLGVVTSCEFYCGNECFCPVALLPIGHLYGSPSFALAQVGVVVLVGNGSLVIAFHCQNVLCTI